MAMRQCQQDKPAFLNPVLWVFRDADSRWRMRKEGETVDREYPSRDLAIADARRFVSDLRSYRLYLQLKDGRFVLELLNPRQQR
jgi:hypothetical protein